MYEGKSFTKNKLRWEMLYCVKDDQGENVRWEIVCLRFILFYD